MAELFAIDPGTTQSGWVLLRDGLPIDFGKEDNGRVRARVLDARVTGIGTRFAVEMIASYGMPVGAEVFETAVWAGRFIETAGDHNTTRVFRKDVKLHLCGVTKAKDGNVRQALIDRFGGQSEAIGLKSRPGPCYGMSGDMWQALALAVTVFDQLQVAA